MRKCDAGYAGDLLSDTITTSWCRINVRYIKNKGERWAYCKKKQNFVETVATGVIHPPNFSNRFSGFGELMW